eukprot:5344995-Pleurochrysis_carterae.AAC.5
MRIVNAAEASLARRASKSRPPNDALYVVGVKSAWPLARRVKRSARIHLTRRGESIETERRAWPNLRKYGVLVRAGLDGRGSDERCLPESMPDEPRSPDSHPN